MINGLVKLKIKNNLLNKLITCNLQLFKKLANKIVNLQFLVVKNQRAHQVERIKR